MKKFPVLYKWQLYSFHDNLRLKIESENKTDSYLKKSEIHIQDFTNRQTRKHFM